MVRVALIGCTSKKRDTVCKAVEMYSLSTLFKYRLEYCKKSNIDKTYILSAKYGLLDLNEIIEPYDLNLKNTDKEYKKEWNEKVLKKLEENTDLVNDEFILLAGKEYTKTIIKSMKYTENPVEGLGIGKQLHYFKEYVNNTLIDASKLRNKDELNKIDGNKPGYYKWWAKKEELDIILEKLEVSFNEIKTYLDRKDDLFSIYVGIAVNESIRKRINWHVNDSHTKSRVESGTLSTLRQSISSIVAEDQYNKVETDKFIDKLKIEYFTLNYPICSEEAKQELECIEKELLNQNLHLLNIKDNKHPQAKPIIKKLKRLRKISKNR